MVALAGLAFASCSNHDDVFTGKTEQEAAYESNFIKRYGQPAPNHTWGFGTSTRSAISTRAIWGGVKNDDIGTDPKNNWWWSYTKLPNPITKKEQAKVYDVFSKTKVTNVKNPNWHYFFVQQVWKGTNKYDSEKNGSFIGSDQMNELLCGKSEESMGHINNGNGGDISSTTVYVANPSDPNNGVERSYDPETELPEGIMLIKNGGTACFGFHNSTDNHDYANYLMLEIDGAYYVGFDWEFNKDEESFAPDGVYTDWIIKIVPAEYTKSPDDSKIDRVFCEDLGTTDDFDFNDVVFDVIHVDGNTLVTLQAAGGTLPIHIKANGVDYGEVHELFGVSTSTMVNTGQVQRPVSMITIPGWVDAKNINVVVEGKDGQEYPLQAEEGKVPYKFAISTCIEWPTERQDFKDKWPGFETWVGNEDDKFWEK